MGVSSEVGWTTITKTTTAKTKQKKTKQKFVQIRLMYICNLILNCNPLPSRIDFLSSRAGLLHIISNNIARNHLAAINKSGCDKDLKHLA